MLRERRRRALGIAVGLLLAAVPSLSCGPSGPSSGPPFGPRPGRRDGGTAVTEVGPAETPAEGVGASGTLYVPVYSHVYTDDAARPFDLAVTLALRNTDPLAPRYLTAVRYHDSDGNLVRDYAPRPLRVAPLAAAEFFVPQNDTTGGSSASFLVEWRAAAEGADAPLAEALMIGTSTNQVISFTSQGRPSKSVPR